MTQSRFDVARVRRHFPALDHGLAFFDGPGGTQTPRQVGEAILHTLTGPLSNRGRDSVSQRNADQAVLAFRAAMADLLDAEPDGIVHGRSATALTYDLARTLSKSWQPGDEVIVTRLDHDCNVRPWVQAAEARGVTVRWAAFETDTGELPVSSVTDLLTDRTRLIAVTGASNLIGTAPDIKAIVRQAEKHGALVWVDAVHAAAHRLLSLRETGADFIVCSPYKFLGPHCGVLAADPALLWQLQPDKLLPAPDRVPERFEHGTLPYETLAGVTAAVDYLADLVPGGTRTRRERLAESFAALGEHEERLRTRIEAALAELPGVQAWSNAAQRTPTLLYTFSDRPAATVSSALLEQGVVAPSGSFYAFEAARHLGLGAAGGLRIGIAPYTSDEDADRLISGVRELLSN